MSIWHFLFYLKNMAFFMFFMYVVLYQFVYLGIKSL